jgi:hypothetical protein
VEYEVRIIGIVTSVIAIVIGSFIAARNEALLSYLKNRFRRSENNVSHGIIKKIEAHDQIQINCYTDISATFEGTIRNGFITCQIVDCLEKFNYCEDRTTTKILGPDRDAETLKFKNETHDYTWPIRPAKDLTKGRGKLIVAMYEENDYFENGILKKDRKLVAVKEKDVMLY